MKNCIIFLLCLVVFSSATCSGKTEDESVEISQFILAAEVTNKQTRNMLIDNAAKKIAFDLASDESKTGVNIRLTLADGVSMISPKHEQADYDLIYPAEIKLSAAGRTIAFTIRVSDFDPISEFILAAEVTNRQTRNMVIKNDAKEITFDLADTEQKTGVNIRLTLAEGVSMVSPAALQADYDLTNPAKIELLAEDRKVVFAVKAGWFDPLYTPPVKDLVIGLWVPPPPHLMTTEADIKMRYKQIADAGINMVLPGAWSYTADDPADNPMTLSVLNACEEYGLEFYLHLQVSKDVNTDAAAELARCIARAEKFRNHPAVRGFFIHDEPLAGIFDRLGTIRREVDAVLPEGKHTISNIFPSGSGWGAPDYETYVEQYMQKVAPKVLSFDHYPLGSVKSSAEGRGFVSNLITIRNAAIKYDVPFWGFIQAVGWTGRREPNLDEYRWLCNAHITGGAKGFSYFIYSATGPNMKNEGEKFSDSMLAWDGTTTHLYDYAKNINKELSAFSRQVMPFVQDGFMPVNQEMNLTIPVELYRTSYGNLSKIETTGEMLNGCFSLNGQKAVYLFNWSRDSSMTAKLVFTGTVNFQLWGRNGLETEQSASEYNVSFVPGEAKFLIFM